MNSSSSRLAEISPETRQTDADLVSASLNGSERAFREIVRRYSGLIYNVVYRMTKHHETSEEMTQDVFIKVYKNLKSYDSTRSFRPWILRIATNTTLSELRRQSRPVVNTASLGELEESGYQPEQPAQTDPLELEESTRQVMQALDRLDPKYKQALLLRYQHGLSYEEVAGSLDVPLNTVRTWLRRGLERLRNEVKEHAL